MISLKTFIKTLCVVTVFAQVIIPQTGYAANSKMFKSKSANQQVLRKISPRKGKLVPHKSILKAPGGTVALTCCTHWNTQSGGTGCASYDDSEGSCPSDTFQVDCGANGCW